MHIKIFKSAGEASRYAAGVLIEQIDTRPNSVLGFASGSTPLTIYKHLANAYKNGTISFAKVISFNLDEYMGISPQHKQSFRYYMESNLFGSINIKSNNTFLPTCLKGIPEVVSTQYEKMIQKAGGINLQLLGIGRNGHIGFNEPSSSLSSRTRAITLSQQTIADNSRFFSGDEFQPHLAITMGIGTILESKKILLVALGEKKSNAIEAAIEGPITSYCPASALQLHDNATIVLDKKAASKLKQTYVN